VILNEPQNYIIRLAPDATYELRSKADRCKFAPTARAPCVRRAAAGTFQRTPTTTSASAWSEIEPEIARRRHVSHDATASAFARLQGSACVGLTRPWRRRSSTPRSTRLAEKLDAPR
jgi:hypothetical protein